MTPPEDPIPGAPGYPTGAAEAPAIEAPPPPGKLKQRVIPDPPEMDQSLSLIHI